MLKSLLHFSSTTFISRLLGLLRDWLYAVLFGASSSMDAFLVAFKIPNFFRRLFAEGAFTQALLPIMVKCEQQTPALYQDYVNAMFSRLLAILFSLAIVGVVAAPIWIAVFAPGFLHKPEQWKLASTLLMLTFPYIVFVSLTAYIVALLNSKRFYLFGAFLPIILNIALITAAVIGVQYLEKPIIALAIGVLVAGLVQLAVILLHARSKGIYVYLRWRLPKAATVYSSEFMRVFLPAILSVSIVQINLIIDMVLASTLDSGSISWLYFSQRLMELPNGVIIVAISTISLTSFAQLVAKQQWHAYTLRITQTLELGICLTLPACIGLLVLAEPIMIILFEYGEFTRQDTHQSALALQAYAFSLIGFLLVKISSSAAFAKQDSKITLQAACIAVFSNIGLSLLLLEPLQHLGLALATSVAALLNGGLLYWLLWRKHLITIHYHWRCLYQALLLNSIFLMALLWIYWTYYAVWLDLQRTPQTLSLLALITVSMSVYAVVIWSQRHPLLQPHSECNDVISNKISNSKKY